MEVENPGILEDEDLVAKNVPLPLPWLLEKELDWVTNSNDSN